MKFSRILFIPTIAYLVVLTIFPLFFSLGISFTDYSLGKAPHFIGFRNYVEFLGDPSFWRAVRNTLIIAIFAVGVEIVLGMLLAGLFRREWPGFGAMRIVLFIPMMLSPLVVAFFWKFLFDMMFGIIPYVEQMLLRPFGIEPGSWLTNPSRALAAIIIVDIWQWTPFVMLLVLAGLQTIPPELYEAATLSNASWWLKFKHITMPYLRFPILLVLLFRMIDTVKLFDTVYILTAGGPGDATVTLSLLTYRYGFMFYETGKAAALSWLIVVLINILAILTMRVMRVGRARPEGVAVGR